MGFTEGLLDEVWLSVVGFVGSMGGSSRPFAESNATNLLSILFVLLAFGDGFVAWAIGYNYKSSRA